VPLWIIGSSGQISSLKADTTRPLRRWDPGSRKIVRRTIRAARR
jgi:hypothetical protein